MGAISSRAPSCSCTCAAFRRAGRRWKLIAAVSHLLTAFLFITSTKLTTSANAIFLQYTAPLYIILLAFWFLHERPTRTDWFSMIVIFSGMFLFFGDKLSLQGLQGNILAALSGVTMAMMTVSLRAQRDGTPIESILIAQVFTVVFGFPLLFRESWTTTNWLIVAYLGVFQIGLAFLLFTTALKHVPAMEATLIGTLEPVLNPLWVAFFLARNARRVCDCGRADRAGGRDLQCGGQRPGRAVILQSLSLADDACAAHLCLIDR